VLRPNSLSIYKTDKEDKLRHKIYLSDLTAVALLKDPKHKRKNVFGLFSPARNFHFQATTSKEAQDWVDFIRKDARIEEEEEEMFLASPIVHRESYFAASAGLHSGKNTDAASNDQGRMMSSSPEPLEMSTPRFMSSYTRRPSHNVESSGLSGNEMASHSDFSDNDFQRVHGASIESLAVQSPPDAVQTDEVALPIRAGMGNRNASQVSGVGIDQDPDRVIWQGWLWLLRSKRGVRQWKDYWAVLRPRNMILYKDESEYTAQFIVHMSAILNVVDIDPVSRTKLHCMQVITEEKSYKFCAHDEEALVQCLGAFKSLLTKRRELEARAAGGASGSS
jgi:hypothetical protein